jgi:hypothetical protein
MRGCRVPQVSPPLRDLGGHSDNQSSMRNDGEAWSQSTGTQKPELCIGKRLMPSPVEDKFASTVNGVSFCSIAFYKRQVLRIERRNPERSACGPKRLRPRLQKR